MFDAEMGDSTRQVKKRQRLSLKASRQKNVTPTQSPYTNDAAARTSPNNASRESISSCNTTSGSSLASTDGCTSVSTDSCTSVSTDGCTSVSTDSCTSHDQNRVPAVASLENIGNTCFMNSVMQILRYTPGFLNNLALLYQDIQGSEKIKKKHKNHDEDTSFEEDNSKRCWRVVKNVYKVYKDLSTLEEKYEEVASDDVMSMSVKPLRILQAIKELNPMYEGHMQHDAQEFLRCFLCYFQDGEKEVQKFYSRLPQKFSPKINPLMQRFLTCSKTSRETKDKIVKIVNNISDVQEETAAETVKVNLFPKSAVKTGVVLSPRKGQVTPKLGDTTDIVVEVDRNMTLNGSIAKACVTMRTAPVDVQDTGHCELHDSTGKQQRGKSTARRGRQYKPYGNSRQRSDNKKNIENKTLKSDKLPNQRKRKGTAVVECKQPSVSDMFGITYSSRKRLGMRGVVFKKSAEELFDELKRAEQSDSCPDIQNEDSSSVTYIKGNETSELNSSCNMEANTVKSSSISNVAWSCPETEWKSLKELVDESSIKDMSKSETSMDCKEHKRSTCRSYQDVFSAFLSDFPDDDSDSVEVQSDSSNEDIILTKKREKKLRGSPRRSPRKLASEVYRSSARKYELSMLASSSKSESSIDTFNRKLQGLQDNCNSSNISQPLIVKSEQEEQSGLTSETEMDDIDIRGEEEIPTTPVALVPVVKLENCDYILGGNSTSVSAAYATKCLTPLKTRRRSSSSSGNYLKQRSQLLSMDIADEELFKKALTEMLRSPVKSRSQYDLIERTFQGTMMLRTRCLECESSRERLEEFHDVSVPVRVEKCDSDTEEDVKENKCDLLDLIEASTEVEKLVEENKYFCDGCKAYVEAERSMHYDVMPDILTLHLKRFSSEVGNPGNIMKINDHVDIPLNLPCLRYRCTQSCLRLDHRYRLYGIVTHSGLTLTSGHYLTYVRTLPNQPAEAVSKQHSLLRNSNNQLRPSSENSVKQTNNTRPTTRRKTGVVTKLPSRFDDNVVTNISVKAFEAVGAKKMKPDLVACLLPSKRFDCEWFECDDETIRVFDESEFVELLSEKSGSLLGTPYLLFYHKSTMC